MNNTGKEGGLQGQNPGGINPSGTGKTDPKKGQEKDKGMSGKNGQSGLGSSSVNSTDDGNAA